MTKREQARLKTDAPQILRTKLAVVQQMIKHYNIRLQDPKTSQHVQGQLKHLLAELAADQRLILHHIKAGRQEELGL